LLVNIRKAQIELELYIIFAVDYIRSGFLYIFFDIDEPGAFLRKYPLAKLKILFLESVYLFGL